MERGSEQEGKQDLTSFHYNRQSRPRPVQRIAPARRSTETNLRKSKNIVLTHIFLKQRCAFTAPPHAG